MSENEPGDAGTQARNAGTQARNAGTEAEAADSDAAQIADLVRRFFAAFVSGPDCVRRLDELAGLFLPGAIVVRTCGDEPTVDDVESFIAPRRRLLTDGSLTEFREWQVDGTTYVFGDIATHLCRYAKSGVLAGEPFTGRGEKSLQLVRTGAGWRISAVAWDDERPVVTPPAERRAP